ncbi:accessory gene regulator ArgB-like protein [Paenibacillus donghaensis]|uniref:ABC transporter permease n=1 Tax=Paenibacillus donghaensis TaxID=414771 RepID=A0A2Z2K7G3_9BACL|nr:accessory gene regulator B family protein [Paenibacillus donghaensis]ASA20977.1 ABC transporter permease [Paenibacillus donghaensis]
MIEFLANKTATAIKKQAPDHPASIAVLKYSLAMIINVTSIILFTYLISLWTGKTKEVLIIMFGFALLRQVSGGKHLKSGEACVIITTSLFTILSFFEVSQIYVVVINLISLLLVMMFAPSRIEKQSRIPKRHYPKLKYISAFLVLLSLIIQSPVLSISFFVQSVTLISRREVK